MEGDLLARIPGHLSPFALIAVAAIVVLALAACGAETHEATSQPATPEAATAPASTDGGSAAAEAPAPSAKLAPAFELPSGTGGAFSLDSFSGDKNVVLVFYRGFW